MADESIEDRKALHDALGEAFDRVNDARTIARKLNIEDYCRRLVTMLEELNAMRRWS